MPGYMIDISNNFQPSDAEATGAVLAGIQKEDNLAFVDSDDPLYPEHVRGGILNANVLEACPLSFVQILIKEEGYPVELSETDPAEIVEE